LAVYGKAGEVTLMKAYPMKGDEFSKRDARA